MSHKHHSIICVGARLMQFVHGSHSRLATELTHPQKSVFAIFRASFGWLIFLLGAALVSTELKWRMNLWRSIRTFFWVLQKNLLCSQKKITHNNWRGCYWRTNHNEFKTKKSGEASQATGDLISNFSHPPQALCQGQCDVSSAGYPGAWSLVDGRAFTNLKETEEEKR